MEVRKVTSRKTELALIVAAVKAASAREKKVKARREQREKAEALDQAELKIKVDWAIQVAKRFNLQPSECSHPGWASSLDPDRTTESCALCGRNRTL